MPLPPIRAISFDLDDTLWPFLPAVAAAEVALHGWLLAEAPGTRAWLPAPSALAGYRARTALARPELAGDLAGLRRASIAAVLADAGEDAGLVDAAYTLFLAARQRVTLYDDVRPALAWLAQRYPLVAVTNGNGSLAIAGIDGHFRRTLAAASFGCAKPDAAIFHAAAEAAGVAPAEMLHVGDDLLLDVAGARRAGLQAAWLRRPDVHGAAEPPEGDDAPHHVLDDLQALCALLEGAGATTGVAAPGRPRP